MFDRCECRSEPVFVNFSGYTEIVAVNLCVCTSVRKRWERAFGIRSNCTVREWIISKTSLHASKSAEIWWLD